tara:strand:+ start:426 stop:533 length:108 start_codon:yes stop_codon:yes gene_type:complete
VVAAAVLVVLVEIRLTVRQAELVVLDLLQVLLVQV